MYSNQGLYMINVFVYGTLKRGYDNHVLLEGSEFIGEVNTKNRYPMVNVEEYFPYLIDRAGVGHNVKGELYKIDELTLLQLDILEGYPDFYTREQIKVVHYGIEISAIVYFLKEEINYDEYEMLEEF